MKNAYPAQLCCPYCHTQLRIETVYKRTLNGKVEFGTVCCACDEFPIIYGISIINKSVNKSIITNLRRNNFGDAFYQALGISRTLLHIPLIGFLIGKLLTPSILASLPLWKFKLIWKYVFRRSHSEYLYFFSRQRESDSLLFFLPTMFIEKEKPSIWLDVGSGICTYYSQLIRSFPKITLVSIEESFLNMYLSSILFPNENVTCICGDIGSGTYFPKKSLDIITCIDSLPFLPDQQRVCSQLCTQVRSQGVVYISHMVEHIYIHNYTHVYPLSRPLVQTFFPSPIILFDDLKLTKSIMNKRNIVRCTIDASTPSIFRYSILWPKKAILTIQKRPIFIPTLTQNMFLWSTTIQTWKNSTY